MQVTPIVEEELRREFKIVVEAREIEDKITARLEILRRDVRMPGFRPGKVSVNLLRKQYGKAVTGEVIEKIVSEESQKAISDQGLRAATQPKVDVSEFNEGEDLQFTVAVELMPDIVPGDFREISLTRLIAEVTDADIDDFLARMAKEEGEQKTVSDRAAASGDVVLLDFTGRVGGEEFEGGSAKDYPLELGSGRFIPGFEDQLVGADAGTNKTVKVRFPDDYQNAKVAGQDAEFSVDVREIRELTPAEIDQAFAEAHGYADIDAVKTAVKGRIEKQYVDKGKARLKRTLLDNLAQSYDFPVPKGMVDQEFETIWAKLTEELTASGVTLGESGKSEEELREEYSGIAQRRIRLGLLLGEVGRLNNITVEPDELKRAIMSRAMQFPGKEKEVVAMYRDNPEAMLAIRGPIFEDKVVDFILAMANLEDKTVSAEELLRDPDEDDESRSKS